jgi:nucleotide sugar dehydrogenase
MLRSDSHIEDVEAEIVGGPDAPIGPAHHPAYARVSRADTFEFDVAIVGMGYVGLPTALSFTHAQRSVLGVDLNPERLHAIRSSAVDLVPADHVRLIDALAEESLDLTSDPQAIARASAVIICVPTPVDHHLVPDLAALRSACASVVANAVHGQVIILTSTSYVGTTRDLLVEPLTTFGWQIGRDVYVAFSPERIDPGNEEFPQEVVPRVVGGATAECASRAASTLQAYASRVHVVSSPEAAELTKLLENTFRAVNIALINEIADLSEELGVEITEVIDAARTKPYGFMAFSPGPGVGGHCIPCDPYYLLWQIKQSRLALPVVEHAMESIAHRPRQVVQRVHEMLGEAGRPLHGSQVLVVGVAYKPGVADVRESPALEVIERLVHAGAEVSYFDPLVPSIRTSAGSPMHSVTEPTEHRADLILLHTLHPHTDYEWVVDHPLVLDATFRFTRACHRNVL